MKYLAYLVNQKNSTENVVAKDAWVNPNTRLGSECGRIDGTQYKPVKNLSKGVLTSLYRGNGIARRIVNSIVNDAIRGFIEADRDLLDELDRIKFKQKLIECASLGRLYGGAIMVAFTIDGSELDTPINLNSLQKVVKMIVYDRYYISWLEDDIEKDFSSEFYGEPSVYTINPPEGGSFRVHRSRCCVMGGVLTPQDVKNKNSGWDDSVIQSVYDSLLQYGTVKNSSAEIVQDFVLKVLTMEGLLLKVATGQEDAIQGRIAQLESQLSNNRLAVVGESEKYEKLNSSIGGLSELWDRFSESICADSETPMSRLFGRNPSGINGNSDNDVSNWDDSVDAYRNDDLTPCFDWIINLLISQKAWTTKPKSIEWDFPALEVLNEKEKAEVKYKLAQTDSIYVGMGSIGATTAYANRYADGTFQYDITVDVDALTDVVDNVGNEDLLIAQDYESESDKLVKEIASKL